MELEIWFAWSFFSLHSSCRSLENWERVNSISLLRSCLYPLYQLHLGYRLIARACDGACRGLSGGSRIHQRQRPFLFAVSVYSYRVASLIWKASGPVNRSDVLLLFPFDLSPTSSSSSSATTIIITSNLTNQCALCPLSFQKKYNFYYVHRITAPMTDDDNKFIKEIEEEPTNR